MARSYRYIIYLSLLMGLAACGFRQAQRSALTRLAGEEVLVADSKVTVIPATPQVAGNAAEGFDYLRYGNYVSAGVPYDFFVRMGAAYGNNELRRTGRPASIPATYNYIEVNGQQMVAPNCFTCHAQYFGDSLFLGMGNTRLNFAANNAAMLPAAHQLFSLNGIYRKNPDFKDLMEKGLHFGPQLRTLSPGVNVADKLTMLLLSQRNPQTLEWQRDSVYFDYPQATLPVDVPAWWLLKKKNAMFYNGYGRGDFRKFLMGSNLLTVRNAAEAKEVYTHFDDVLAYIYSIEPPKYPLVVDRNSAAQGEQVFTTHCSKCHGTYGENASYPNKLIPDHIVNTDSLLWKANFSHPGYINWFNSSVLSDYDNRPAKLIPFKGYIAPPLDGIWATAPYFHNGSVPTLQAVIDSRQRPVRWERGVWRSAYNTEAPGWEYTTAKKGDKKVYDTTIPGYGNQGHTFGDALTAAERKALLDYLKTL